MSTRIHGGTKGEGDYVRIGGGGGSLHLTDSATPVMETGPTKTCRVCGENVTHKPRMKDHEGNYWCYECGMADQQHKQASMVGAPAVAPKPTCAECHEPVAGNKFLDFGGRKVCAVCAEKLERSAQRESARLAAADEENARQERNYRLLMATLTILALAAVTLALWRLM